MMLLEVPHYSVTFEIGDLLWKIVGFAMIGAGFCTAAVCFALVRIGNILEKGRR